MPQSFNFGECRFGVHKSTHFNIYNFGESEIHYELGATHRGARIGDPSKNLLIYPMYGTVKQRETERIMVSIQPNALGLHQFCINYKVRTHMFSMDIAEDAGTKLFCLDYFSVIPMLQVSDI